MPTIEVSNSAFERLTLMAVALGTSRSDVVDSILTRYVKEATAAMDDKPQGAVPEGKVTIYKIYRGYKVEGHLDPDTGVIHIMSPPWNGERFKSPSQAMRAVISHYNPDVSPHGNGWTWWRSTSTGIAIDSYRQRSGRIS